MDGTCIVVDAGEVTVEAPEYEPDDDTIRWWNDIPDISASGGLSGLSGMPGFDGLVP